MIFGWILSCSGYFDGSWPLSFTHSSLFVLTLDQVYSTQIIQMSGSLYCLFPTGFNLKSAIVKIAGILRQLHAIQIVGDRIERCLRFSHLFLHNVSSPNPFLCSSQHWWIISCCLLRIILISMLNILCLCVAYCFSFLSGSWFKGRLICFWLVLRRHIHDDVLGGGLRLLNRLLARFAEGVDGRCIREIVVCTIFHNRFWRLLLDYCLLLVFFCLYLFIWWCIQIALNNYRSPFLTDLHLNL